MYSKNIFIITLIFAVLYASAAAKKRTKTKLKQSRIPVGSPISLPGCGCQNPLFNIVDCGCHSPIIDTSYTLVSYEAPACGCQQLIDIPNYRYVDTIEIISPMEVSNYGYLGLPGVEYVNTIELPCGCQGNKCGCRAPIQLPASYGAVEVIDVPNCGCHELTLPVCNLGALASIIEVPSLAPTIQVSGCGCVGPCGCQTLSCGCQGPVCGCQTLSCGCQGPICGCQTLSCGCQGPVCGCQSVMPCGCQGPICGCQSVMPCGCQGPICGCQSVMPCGCSGAVCGCQSPLPCGCQGTTCGCQTIEIGACGVPGCPCDGKFLRQITLQPPFL